MDQKPNISDEIEELIIQENPDILCVQEYSRNAPELKGYKFRYIYPNPSKKENQPLQFFKIKINGKGFIDFDNSSNSESILILNLESKITCLQSSSWSFKLDRIDSITNSSFSKILN